MLTVQAVVLFYIFAGGRENGRGVSENQCLLCLQAGVVIVQRQGLRSFASAVQLAGADRNSEQSVKG